MASGSAQRVYSSSTAASTVDTATFGLVSRTVSVVNRGGGDLFVTVNGATPTVAGPEIDVVPANTEKIIKAHDQLPATDSGTQPTQTVVRLISSAVVAYTVTLL